MAVPLLDRHGVGIDDDVARFVLLGVRKRAGRRLRIGLHRSAVEILAPASIGGLEHDDAIRKPVGGDDIGHSGSLTARAQRPTHMGLTYLTARIYAFVFIANLYCDYARFCCGMR